MDGLVTERVLVLVEKHTISESARMVDRPRSKDQISAKTPLF